MLLYEILQGNYMPIEVDSVSEKYALPLARKVQTLPSSDPYLKVFAVYDEYALLKRLKRNAEALKVLTTYHAKDPKEPIVLFELARMKILAGDTKGGLSYLHKTKQNLNAIVTKEAFREVLKEADFNKVRNTAEFKKLSE